MEVKELVDSLPNKSFRELFAVCIDRAKREKLVIPNLAIECAEEVVKTIGDNLPTLNNLRSAFTKFIGHQDEENKNETDDNKADSCNDKEGLDKS